MQRDVRPHKPNPHFTFQQKPSATLRSFQTRTHTHTRIHTCIHTLRYLSQTHDGTLGNLFTVRVPDQVWKGFIQITKLYFNTKVSLYKLPTGHGELRGCGPKLK